MEVIRPRRALARPSLVPIVGSTVFGTLLVSIGLALAYVAYATPFLAHVVPAGRIGPGETILGMATWGLALVAPAGLVLLGTSRLAGILGAARARMVRRSTVQRAIDPLDDVVLARGLTLPDGRGVAELLVGPFGAAVIRELPPAGLTRIRNGHWEVRVARGWLPLDDPLERTVRDAERVRRWLAHDDADFVVKTYAAVITTDPTIQRTTACAVLSADQLTAWVAALPAQRSLTAGRRDRLVAMVRDAAI